MSGCVFVILSPVFCKAGNSLRAYNLGLAGTGCVRGSACASCVQPCNASIIQTCSTLHKATQQSLPYTQGMLGLGACVCAASGVDWAQCSIDQTVKRFTMGNNANAALNRDRQVIRRRELAGADGHGE